MSELKDRYADILRISNESKPKVKAIIDGLLQSGVAGILFSHAHQADHAFFYRGISVRHHPSYTWFATIVHVQEGDQLVKKRVYASFEGAHIMMRIFTDSTTCLQTLYEQLDDNNEIQIPGIDQENDPFVMAQMIVDALIQAINDDFTFQTDSAAFSSAA